MNARFALYLILLIALLSSVSLVLFVKYFSYRQQMIIQSSEQKSSILHPPTNLKKDGEKISNNNGPRIHDTTNKDTQTTDSDQKQQSETQPSSTDNFNVQKIETKKKNHQTSIIDGFYDDRIDILEAKSAINQLGENLEPEQPKDNSNLKVSVENVQCRNTKQGAEYITDSLGYVCSIMHVDPKTRCCKHIDDEQARKDGLPPVERYSCSTCHTNQCCSSYEHCVSCCMDIDKREDLQRSFQQWKDEKLFKGVKTVFELCLLRCRTTSKSVQNETRYKDSRYRYCYGSIN